MNGEQWNRSLQEEGSQRVVSMGGSKHGSERWGGGLGNKGWALELAPVPRDGAP